MKDDKLRYIKEFLRFIKHICHSRELLITLIKNDFKKQYLGSYLGLLWAFIQPLTFIIVIWFVFEIGFRTGSSNDEVPFFLYLICGMIPWFFISNTLKSATGSVVNNSFLVKKVAFRVSILPLVKIGSELILHFVLICILIVVFLLYGYRPNIYWLQAPFYILCTITLLLGIAWLTSAVRVFIKDIGDFISVLIQIGFWATPIFWSADNIPANYQWIIKLNPFYYIVNGYRNTFIQGIWFWEHYGQTLYYWGLAIFSLAFGAIVFKRLRPHFGDVL